MAAAKTDHGSADTAITDADNAGIVFFDNNSDVSIIGRLQSMIAHMRGVMALSLQGFGD